MRNKFYTVCGIVFIENRLLLVRHTYGSAKGRILLPGGYVEENEMPTHAIAREIFEETSVKAEANSVVSVQFKPNEWCVVFLMDYISGEPKPDNYENSEVLLLTVDEALDRPDLTNMSKVIISKIKNEELSKLDKSGYIAASADKDTYAIFGV